MIVVVVVVVVVVVELCWFKTKRGGVLVTKIEKKNGDRLKLESYFFF